VKSRQAKQVKGEFEKALSDYQKEEIDYRNRYRDQIARQYKVKEAGELDWGNEGVFTTAVSPHEPPLNWTIVTTD
jgi:syntaxin 1B/2/3